MQHSSALEGLIEATHVADIRVDLVVAVLGCMYNICYPFLMGGSDFLTGLIRALF